MFIWCFISISSWRSSNEIWGAHWHVAILSYDMSISACFSENVLKMRVNWDYLLCNLSFCTLCLKMGINIQLHGRRLKFNHLASISQKNQSVNICLRENVRVTIQVSDFWIHPWYCSFFSHWSFVVHLISCMLYTDTLIWSSVARFDLRTLWSYPQNGSTPLNFYTSTLWKVSLL